MFTGHIFLVFPSNLQQNRPASRYTVMKAKFKGSDMCKVTSCTALHLTPFSLEKTSWHEESPHGNTSQAWVESRHNGSRDGGSGEADPSVLSSQHWQLLLCQHARSTVRHKVLFETWAYKAATYFSWIKQKQNCHSFFPAFKRVDATQKSKCPKWHKNSTRSHKMFGSK